MCSRMHTAVHAAYEQYIPTIYETSKFSLPEQMLAPILIF